jgi:hypothetical protein
MTLWAMSYSDVPSGGAPEWQDFALLLARENERILKYASALATSGLGDIAAISPAVRCMSASHHLSLVVSTALSACAMQATVVDSPRFAARCGGDQRSSG